MSDRLTAPFPWFGGKRRAAAMVWERFGDVMNYVEPFAGSLAVLLARSTEPGIETVNDIDCYITNFWRAVRSEPDEVAKWSDWPVSELDQNARHLWLVSRADLREKMNTDPDWFDAKAAGWWVYGQNTWIGTGWCDQAFYRDGHPPATPADLGDAGKGIHRQLPHLGNAGKGLIDWMERLAARLRRVRICCGDWSRVMGPSVTIKHGLTGVFLDPPYLTKNDGGYASGDDVVAAEVVKWCAENGDNPLLRIALCGYSGEHDLPGWRVDKWRARKGYQKVNADTSHTGHLECIWFSPNCLEAERQSEMEAMK